MRRHILSILISISFLACISCTPVTIESNVRSGYAKKISQIFILLNTRDNSSRSFFLELKPALEKRLAQHNVKSTIHVYDTLGLDEKKIIQAKIEQAKPTHLLTINQTSKSTMMQRGAFGGTAQSSGIGAIFELVLQEPASEDILWKANLETKGTGFVSTFGSSTGSVGDSEATADKIIESLLKDNLLPS